MRKPTRVLLALLFVVFAGLAGWYFLREPAPPLQRLEPLVEGNTDFALKLFAQVRSGQSNIIFSPYGISCALGLLHAGARGQTAQQLARTATFPQSATNLPGLFHELDTQLHRAASKGRTELTIANSVWTQAGYQYQRDFLDSVKANYHAVVSPVNFAEHPDQAIATINQWVDENTRHKIPVIMGPAEIDRSTRLALANVIYFKGIWAAVFHEGDTQPGEFFVSSNRTVTVPMMSQSGEFRYFSNTNLQCVVLPYRKGQFDMVLLLPRSGGRRHPSSDGSAARGTFTLEQLESALSDDNITAWLNVAQKTEIRVSIPKFRIQSGYLLNDLLAAMGMKDAFDSHHADFSGISSGTEPLFVNAVVHKAVIDVNEKGTEAAAATIGEVMSAGIPPEPFVADHPFLFLVRETATGTILFMGRLLDPESGQGNF